jgi:hypothetical protein
MVISHTPRRLVMSDLKTLELDDSALMAVVGGGDCCHPRCCEPCFEVEVKLEVEFCI